MTTYLVNDIYATIQGEGVQTGVAMTLLRLHGCGVGCPWCDTKETWAVDETQRVTRIEEALGANSTYAAVDEHEIVSYIEREHSSTRWVLLTGGEPAAQQLRPLVDALHQRGYKVALETSGTETGHVDAGIDWVCVSPKINMPGGKTIQPAAIAVADEIKHVVGKPQDIAALDDLLATMKTKDIVQICLQPVSVNEKATALCIQTVQDRGWRLSIQLHKYINQR